MRQYVGALGLCLFSAACARAAQPVTREELAKRCDPQALRYVSPLVTARTEGQGKDLVYVFRDAGTHSQMVLKNTFVSLRETQGDKPHWSQAEKAHYQASDAVIDAELEAKRVELDTSARGDGDGSGIRSGGGAGSLGFARGEWNALNLGRVSSGRALGLLGVWETGAVLASGPFLRQGVVFAVVSYVVQLLLIAFY